MQDLPPLFLSRDRILRGLNSNDIAKRVKAGTLVRVRHGVYVDGAAWRELKPWQQYRLRVQAAAETFQKPTIFARHSAASVWGVPTIGLHHQVEALTLKNDGGRSRAGVSRYYAGRTGLDVVRREGLLVTDRIRTVLDLAAFTPFTEAVAPVDHVLRPDRNRQLPALTTAELEAGTGGIYSAAAGQRIRAVLGFADPASGSAGESLSRALIRAAGFEAPVLQQQFSDASPRDCWAAPTSTGSGPRWWASSTVRTSTSSSSSSRAGRRRRLSWRRRTARTGSGPWATTWFGGTGRTSWNPGSWNVCSRRPVCPAVVPVLLSSTLKTRL